MPEVLHALTRSSELDGGDVVTELLTKVRREWQVEREVEQDVRGHFQLSYVDADQAVGLSTQILDRLEDAYAELGSELDYSPDVRVPVLLYSDDDFAMVPRSPDWAVPCMTARSACRSAGWTG